HATKRAERMLLVPSPPEPPRRRSTVKQRAVLKVLREQDNFRSAQQLYLELLRQRELRIGLTSVYRILHTLAADEIAETQRAEDRKSLSHPRPGPGHLPSLLCRCGATAVGFVPDETEEPPRLLSRQHHYTDVTHYVDLYGVCPLCHGASAPQDGV